MDFSKLNEVCRAENFLPTKPWNKLEVKTKYKVTEITIVKTKFGESIVITLNEGFTVFLPSRTVKLLLKDREQYKLLADAATNGTLTIHYIGGQYGEFEFIHIK
ncbi:hypothetical protein PV327_011220 [Microctonus hyperodae]|uniref:Uncharacterized protein n=1 Tax=Microctonus hyperodae TaxID=165561 RepID=A0AA39KRS1_MICHY|nr:hypothetical protein PV327_011220 [Microctonus hyperodae]